MTWLSPPGKRMHTSQFVRVEKIYQSELPKYALIRSSLFTNVHFIQWGSVSPFLPQFDAGVTDIYISLSQAARRQRFSDDGLVFLI